MKKASSSDSVPSRLIAGLLVYPKRLHFSVPGRGIILQEHRAIVLFYPAAGISPKSYFLVDKFYMKILLVATHVRQNCTTPDGGILTTMMVLQDSDRSSHFIGNSSRSSSANHTIPFKTTVLPPCSLGLSFNLYCHLPLRFSSRQHIQYRVLCPQGSSSGGWY